MKTFFNKFNRFFLFLLVLVMSPSQMWGATGDLLDINFTDWYNDGGTTQAAGTHYIYTASSGTYKRSNVAYFTNSAYSQSVPSATNYVCVTCSTSTYNIYAKNNTYLSEAPDTYLDSYTVSHNSNTTAPTTVVFTLSSPAVIELLVGATSIGNTNATYGYTAPSANATKVQRAYHFLKTYDYATGSYPLADEIQLKSKDAIAYVTDTTTVAGTVSYEFSAGNLYNSNGGNKKFYIYAIRVTTYSATPSCQEPAAPTISGTESYTEGETITLTASTNGSNHSATTTYTWYKGADWATASAADPVQAAAVAGSNGHIFTKTAALGDAGTYWCEAANGTCKSHNATGKTITVSESAAAKHAISYNTESLKGQSVSGYPTEFTEGVGIASFDPLDDVTNFHFSAWNPPSIGTEVTEDVELTATWVAAYNVSFNKNGGGGSAPAGFQKWSGATFNLPGQGEMTAPSGKVFDGWKANGTGAKLAANAEYTMTAAAVEFVAQWKSVPQTIFDWTKGSGAQITADNTNLNGNNMGTLTTGTSVVARKLGENNIDNNGAGYKLGNDDVCIEIQGTSAFQEGDTVIITGQNGGSGDRNFMVAPSSATSASSTDAIATNTIGSQTANSVYKVVLTDTQAGAKIRVFRLSGKTMYCKSIKVRRPAARDIASTVISLSDLKVNNRSISSDSLATLVSNHSLTLGDSYAEAPEIKFNERTVITYADGEEPATKTTNKVYTVTASTVTGNWQAAQTINSVAYTVTAAKLSSYTVVYKDGDDELGSENVAVGQHPAGISTPTKDCYTFAAWSPALNTVSGAADETVYVSATWTGNYAFGDYSFVNVAEVGTAPNKLTMTNNTTVNVSAGSRVDNFYFSAMAIKYEEGASSVLTDYKGWKINTNDATIKFLVENDAQVKVGIGSANGITVTYTEPDGTAKNNIAQAQQSEGSYLAKAGTLFTIKTTTGNTTTLKYIKIGDIPAESDDATLSDLTVGGVTVDGFASNIGDYYIELPYGTEDAPTVAGTAHDANATSVTPTQAAALPGNATVVVVAEDGEATKTYTVHFTVAPKLGVELIKATHTNATTASKAGYWEADVTVDKNTYADSKLGGNGNYFGLKLGGSKKFMNGDVLCIYLKTNQTASAWLQVFKDKGSNIIIDKQSGVTKGTNYFTLSGLPEDGIDELYVYRTSTAAGKMNPYVEYIAVYREMPSFFESFTVAGVPATIDETVSPKTISVEVPAVTDITSLTPTYKAWANGGATVSPTTAQNFSAGAIDYTVTSAYSEATTYKVTVTKAAAIKEVVISGTLTVMEDATTTLSAVVYDTNDQEAGNQNVTWSVKAGDEDLASVDANGVVTGKAVGTAHIIATSVADPTVSKTVEVTITQFIGTKYAYWFTKAADIPEDLANDDGTIFEGAPSSGSSANASMTVEINGVERTFDVTARSGDVGFGTFHVPAGFTADLYVLAVGSGSPRTLKLQETTTSAVYKSNPEEFGSDAVKLVFSNVAAGDYTFDKGSQNSRIFMMVAELNKYPLSSVTLSNMTLRTEGSRTPAMTLVHAKAAVASQTWSIVSSTATGTTINESTGEITAGTTPGVVNVQVVVHDALGNKVTSNVATVNIVDIIEQETVTGAMTWNWNGAAAANTQITSDEALVLANYLSGDKWAYLKGTKNDYAYKTDASGCYESKGTLSFTTAVDGIVRITAKRISTDAVLKIGDDITVGTVTSNTQTFAPIFVKAGEINIVADATKGARITKLEFLMPGYEDQNVPSGETNISTLKDGANITVHNGGTLVIDAAKTINDLNVENGGKVQLAANKLTVVGKFAIESTMAGGTSGQLTGATGENFEAAEAYIDITLGAGATSAQWHAFTVPFPVDAVNDVYATDNTKLTNETNYAIMEYLGDVRATGAYGWKKYRKTLVPGTFYLMTVDGGRTTYRFKKTAAGAIVAGDSKSVSQYAASGDGQPTDAGWNGIGNPTLKYGKVDAEVQVLDPVSYTFIKKDANSTNFVVGTPFFYQAEANGSISMLEANAGASYAPRRSPAKGVEKIKVAFGNEEFTDYLDISASEEATNDYQIGKDLAKMIMTSTPKVAQIYGKAYNTNLCMIHAPLTNDKAEFSATLYTPAAGEYSISAPATVDADVYLTKDGMILWNLSMSAYTLTLDKGFTTGYGLLLVKKAPEVATGIENGEVLNGANGVQKVIIDEHVYILREGQMYDVNGQMVK